MTEPSSSSSSSSSGTPMEIDLSTPAAVPTDATGVRTEDTSNPTATPSSALPSPLPKAVTPNAATERPKEWVLHGERVWVKVGSAPWWPAQVLTEGDLMIVPSEVVQEFVVAKKDTLVRLYGTHEWFYCNSLDTNSIQPWEYRTPIHHNLDSLRRAIEEAIGGRQVPELQVGGVAAPNRDGRPCKEMAIDVPASCSYSTIQQELALLQKLEQSLFDQYRALPQAGPLIERGKKQLEEANAALAAAAAAAQASASKPSRPSRNGARLASTTLEEPPTLPSEALFKPLESEVATAAAESEKAKASSPSDETGGGDAPATDVLNKAPSS